MIVDDLPGCGAVADPEASAPLALPVGTCGSSVADALAWLDGLGAPGRIARCFRETGIAGPRYGWAGFPCPVAAYVLAVTGERVVVNGNAWFAVDAHSAEPGGAMPATVGLFIRRFDRGSYSDLDVRPVVA